MRNKIFLFTLCIVLAHSHALPKQANGQSRGEQEAEIARLTKESERLKKEGKTAEALLLMERLIELKEKLVGSDTINVASFHQQLASAFWKNGDFDRAERHYLYALKIEEQVRGPEHKDLFYSVYALGMLNVRKNEYAKAEHYMDRAAKMKGQDIVAEYVNSADYFERFGDYVHAEWLIQRVLAFLKKESGEDNTVMASLYNRLAILYAHRGDVDRAISYYLRALEIYEKEEGADNADLQFLLFNLAWAYMKKGDYTKAEELLIRNVGNAEKAYGPESAGVANELSNLAVLYHEMGLDSKAELLYERALKIEEKLLGDSHPLLVYALDGLASIYGDKGDYERAEKFYLRAVSISEKNQNVDYGGLNVIDNLAMLYIRKGDVKKAEPLIQRSQETHERLANPNQSAFADSLVGFAMQFYQMGDSKRAAKFQARANGITENNIRLSLTSGSEQQKRAYLRDSAWQVPFTISLHTRGLPGSREVARLAVTTILQRKGRDLDAVTDQMAKLRGNATPADLELLDRYAAVRTKLANLQLSGGDQQAAEARGAEAAGLAAEADKLENEISLRSAAFRTQVQPITLDAVRQAIPADAALVEFYAYKPFKAVKSKIIGEPPRYVVYVLRRDAPTPLWVELGEIEKVNAVVRQMRGALRNHARGEVKTIGRALDEEVFRPVRKLLGGARQVFISPDGLLNLIPFAALVDEDGRYLIENYTITYLTSGRDLMHLPAQSESKQAPTIFANPMFDTSRRASAANGQQRALSLDFSNQKDVKFGSLNFADVEYPPLAGSEEEARALKALLPDALVLTGADANEALMKGVRSPRILHVATHGFFFPDRGRDNTVLGKDTSKALQTSDDDSMLRSGLILAGVNQRSSGKGEDGVLTALEASGLDLWGTKLVVLSACETGLGDVQAGEGIYGLRRALVLAGAESQVMSLWKVNDDITRDFMIYFYTRLKAGEGRGEALRNAQLKMFNSAETSHPYFWASFIGSGDWKSLNSDGAAQK
jgi:CHAT domain-containing protein/lipopolysaccharide biosynthesis regulator YciM